MKRGEPGADVGGEPSPGADVVRVDLRRVRAKLEQPLDYVAVTCRVRVRKKKNRLRQKKRTVYAAETRIREWRDCRCGYARTHRDKGKGYECESNYGEGVLAQGRQ